MGYVVSVAQEVFVRAHERYGDERSPTGEPSEYDFVSGPLAAALAGFQHFDDLPVEVVPAVRSLIVVDPFFGTINFIAVLVGTDTVEIAAFDDDPDYWSMIDSPLE